MNRTRSTMLSAGLVAVLLGTAACSSGSGGSAGGSGAGGQKKPYQLAFVQGVAGDAFYVTMQCGMEAEAKKLNATVRTQGAQKFDSTLQTPLVQSVVASKPDALMIAPTDASAMQQPINQAKTAGIKVVLVDTTLNDPSVAASAISSAAGKP